MFSSPHENVLMLGRLLPQAFDSGGGRRHWSVTPAACRHGRADVPALTTFCIRIHDGGSTSLIAVQHVPLALYSTARHARANRCDETMFCKPYDAGPILFSAADHAS